LSLMNQSINYMQTETGYGEASRVAFEDRLHEIADGLRNSADNRFEIDNQFNDQQYQTLQQLRSLFEDPNAFVVNLSNRAEMGQHEGDRDIMLLPDGSGAIEHDVFMAPNGRKENYTFKDRNTVISDLQTLQIAVEKGQSHKDAEYRDRLLDDIKKLWRHSKQKNNIYFVKKNLLRGSFLLQD